MSNAKKVQDFLTQFENVPPEVLDAAKGLQDVVKSRGLKGAFLDNGGRFSTMRTINFIGNITFIVMFIILGMTAGNTVDIEMFKDGLTVPEFPATAAGALALIINGTYAYKHKTNVENGH